MEVVRLWRATSKVLIHHLWLELWVPSLAYGVTIWDTILSYPYSPMRLLTSSLLELKITSENGSLNDIMRELCVKIKTMVRNWLL